MRLLVTICSFFILFSSAAQQTNVLFIGNSYTHMNKLCKIFENLANSKGKYVFGDTLAVSGSTLQGHTLRSNTYKKIKARNWDYVFIQGFSRELNMDSATIATQTIPYAQQLIDSIKKYNSCANIYYYMTWGYADGHQDSIPEDTYVAMQERIQRGYLQLSEATGGYPIAPVGMVWKGIREKYPEINLYAPDNAHPNHNGSYTAACTFYTAIYKQSPLEGKTPHKVEAKAARKIEKEAADYVLSYYPFYNLDTLQREKPTPPVIDFSLSENWLSITALNKTTGGSAYFWDFGDGNTSSKRSPKHYYQKPGKYTVTLFVKKDCHWTSFQRKITVSNRSKKGNTPKPVTTKKN
jgi:hypothetical protein